MEHTGLLRGAQNIQNMVLKMDIFPQETYALNDSVLESDISIKFQLDDETRKPKNLKKKTEIKPDQVKTENIDNFNNNYDANQFPNGESNEVDKKDLNQSDEGVASIAPEDDYDKVYIWDLDETILQTNAMKNGIYAQKFQKNPNLGLSIVIQLEEVINQLAEVSLFWRELDDCDHVHIDDVQVDEVQNPDMNNFNFMNPLHSQLGMNPPVTIAEGYEQQQMIEAAQQAAVVSAMVAASAPNNIQTTVRGGSDWMRKLSFKYKRIREIYEIYQNEPTQMMLPAVKEQMAKLFRDYNAFTDNWTIFILRAIHSISQNENCVNVVVSNSPFVFAVAKLICFRLTDMFKIRDIYSSNKIGKEGCFERIVSRFGKDKSYTCIGSTGDNEHGARRQKIPFWPVLNHGDAASLVEVVNKRFL